MKRALQLLLALPLVVVAFAAAPAEARSCSLTCSDARQQCNETCLPGLCTVVFSCDSSDPCDSSCACIQCHKQP
jgi:hypothetical protein